MKSVKEEVVKVKWELRGDLDEVPGSKWDIWGSFVRPTCIFCSVQQFRLTELHMTDLY